MPLPDVISRSSYPNRDDWCAFVLSVTTVAVRVIRWRCPDCGVENATTLWPGKHRLSMFRVEARCGHCHGRSRTLLTRDSRTIKP